MPTTCSSPFRPTPTTPPRPRRSPTLMAIFWWWGRGTCSTGFAWRGRTRRMGALSMPPTRTTCSPGSAAPGIRAEPAAWSCAPRYGMYFDQTQVGLFAQNVQAPGAFPFVRPVSHGRLRRQRHALESRRRRHSDPALRGPVTRSRSPQVTGSWRRDGSTGTSACSGAFTPAG